MKVWVISPGWGRGVFVGVLLDVGDGEGVRVGVFVGAGVGVGFWNGLTQALSSMIAIRKKISKVGVRFIEAYCTLRETGRGNLYNDERFSGP
jgi:hypothetical protein